MTPRWAADVALLAALACGAGACVMDADEPAPPDDLGAPPSTPSDDAAAVAATPSGDALARDRPTYTLTAAAAGSGTGTITGAAANIACGPTCEGKVIDGALVELAAEADPGARFVGWLGGGCQGTGACVVAVHRSQTVTAVFALDAFVEVVRAGGGTGVVTADHGDLACGAVCDAAYPADAVVTLTASAAPGDVFTGWSGEGCSGTGPCTLVLDDDPVEVVATFEPR